MKQVKFTVTFRVNDDANTHKLRDELYAVIDEALNNETLAADCDDTDMFLSSATSIPV